MDRIRKAITFSNVVAGIALFAALGGSVYAAGNKINGTQIKPKSLPGNRIKAKSLTAKQIRASTITGKQVKANSLTGREVVGSSLSGVSASSLGAVQYASVAVSMGAGGVVGPPRITAAGRRPAGAARTA
ncbi:MAG: hypothetical protein ABW065_03055 [Solirubrobacterales bacterium]